MSIEKHCTYVKQSALLSSHHIDAPKPTRLEKAVLGAKAFPSLPDCARVRQPVIEVLFSISSATVWRRVKDGRLPQPRLDGRITSWSVGEIRKSLAEGK